MANTLKPQQYFFEKQQISSNDCCYAFLRQQPNPHEQAKIIKTQYHEHKIIKNKIKVMQSKFKRQEENGRNLKKSDRSIRNIILETKTSTKQLHYNGHPKTIHTIQHQYVSTVSRVTSLFHSLKASRDAITLPQTPNKYSVTNLPHKQVQNAQLQIKCNHRPMKEGFALLIIKQNQLDQQKLISFKSEHLTTIRKEHYISRQLKNQLPDISSIDDGIASSNDSLLLTINLISHGPLVQNISTLSMQQDDIHNFENQKSPLEILLDRKRAFSKQKPNNDF